MASSEDSAGSMDDPEDHAFEFISNTEKGETNGILARVNQDVSLQDYMDVDEQAMTWELMSDDDIVDSVLQPADLSSAVCEDDIKTEEAVPIVKDTQKAVLTFTRFFEQQGTDFDLIVQLDHDVKGCAFQNKKQTQITDYI